MTTKAISVLLSRIETLVVENDHLRSKLETSERDAQKLMGDIIDLKEELQEKQEEVGELEAKLYQTPSYSESLKLQLEDAEHVISRRNGTIQELEAKLKQLSLVPYGGDEKAFVRAVVKKHGTYKIGAIKEVRAALPYTLKEAKDIVENCIADLSSQESTTPNDANSSDIPETSS